MRQRPRVFDLLALSLLLIAFSLPVQVMFLFGHQPFEFQAIVHKLAPMNWVVALLAIAGAVAHWRASPFIWVISPAFIGAVIWNNYLVAQAGLNYDMTSTVLATGGTLLLHGLLLTPTARKVLLNPNMRWWLTAPRKRVSLRATVWPTLGGELITSTFDISEGGAFLSIDEASYSTRLRESIRNLNVGSHCSVKVKLDDKRAIHCSAEVVRQTNGRGQYPGGFAIRFSSLSREDRQLLNQFVKNVDSAPKASSAGPSGMSFAA